MSRVKEDTRRQKIVIGLNFDTQLMGLLNCEDSNGTVVDLSWSIISPDQTTQIPSCTTVLKSKNGPSKLIPMLSKSNT